MKKVAFFIIIIFILIAFICYICLYFGGKPWERAEAEAIAKAYAQARNYAEYKVTSCVYDYKNKMYEVCLASAEKGTRSYKIKISADNQEICKVEILKSDISNCFTEKRGACASFLLYPLTSMVKSGRMQIGR